jgi:hypothetical protein
MKKRGNNPSPRNKKACNNISTTLLECVAGIGTQSTMKSSKKTLHEFSTHIPLKTSKRNRITLLHKSPDMHYAKHRLVKNTLPSHHVKQDDTPVPPNCRRAENQAVSRHSGWLNVNLKRVLSAEFVELSPSIPMKFSELHTSF